MGGSPRLSLLRNTHLHTFIRNNRPNAPLPSKIIHHQLGVSREYFVTKEQYESKKDSLFETLTITLHKRLSYTEIDIAFPS